MTTNYNLKRKHITQIDIPTLRATCARLHSYIERMRFEERSKALDRVGTLKYIEDQIEGLKEDVDLPQGWTDPDDSFSTTALEVLRLEFGELTRPDNPYPVPLDDPRERTLNGKLFAPWEARGWPPTQEVVRMDGWNEGGERWQAFVKGYVPARFRLLDGTEIIVVPMLATPPPNKQWVRPDDFWKLVPTSEPYQWSEPSPFDWGTEEPTAAGFVLTPPEREIKKMAMVKVKR